ncbi:Os01g0650000, partial [Oryza sativa Japonica Group]
AERKNGFLYLREKRRAAAVVLAAVAVLLSASQALAAPCYPRVFSFGDSLTDTGNIAFLYGNDSRRPTLWPPYGETFFHRATGRASNGRLIIDFIGTLLATNPAPPPCICLIQHRSTTNYLRFGNRARCAGRS